MQIVFVVIYIVLEVHRIGLRAQIRIPLVVVPLALARRVVEGHECGLGAFVSEQVVFKELGGSQQWQAQSLGGFGSVARVRDEAGIREKLQRRRIFGDVMKWQGGV